MRSVFAIYFIFIFGLPPALTALWFAHQRYQVRQAFKQSRPKAELVYLSFSSTAATRLLDWKEPDEFRYKGQMYDVIQTAHTSDSLRYWCWPDAADTQLYAQLEELLTRDPERTTQLENLFYFLKLLFIVSIFIPCFFQSLPASLVQWMPYLSGPCYKYASPPSPPPRMVYL